MLEVLSNEFSNISASNENDFDTESIKYKEDDLFRMLGFVDKEAYTFFKYSKEDSARMMPPILDIPDYFIRNHGNTLTYESRYIKESSALMVIMFHDSFGEGMVKFIKESFEESIFIWSSFDMDIIQKERPDVVILELAERDVELLLNIN